MVSVRAGSVENYAPNRKPMGGGFRGRGGRKLIAPITDAHIVAAAPRGRGGGGRGRGIGGRGRF